MNLLEVAIERSFDDLPALTAAVGPRLRIGVRLLPPRITRWKWFVTSRTYHGVFGRTFMTPLFSVDVEYWQRTRDI